VTALARGDGSERWRGDVRPSRPPAVTADRVVAASGSTVTAYRTDGTVAWETDLGDDVTAGPVAWRDTVTVAVRSGGASTLLAFGTADGSLRWSLSVDPRLDALPAVADGGLVAASNDGSGGPERLFVVGGG
jgi:outer membrane protein assembly factor BamB